MLKQPAFVLCAAMFAVVISAVGEQAGPEGGEPYSPTRIEWLALELQAFYGDNSYRDDPYVVHFHHHGHDTIEVQLRYNGRRDGGVERELQTAKEMVGFLAKQHGWQDWVKVTEDVKNAREE